MDDLWMKKCMKTYEIESLTFEVILCYLKIAIIQVTRSLFHFKCFGIPIYESGRVYKFNVFDLHTTDFRLRSKQRFLHFYHFS